MRLTGTALRLTIMVGESDLWHHKPLFTEIVHRAHKAGLAGATVLRGIEGYGASNLIHTTRLLSLTEDLPVVVVIVDTHDRIHDFLPQLDELVSEGLMILDDCEVIRYVGRDLDDITSDQDAHIPKREPRSGDCSSLRSRRSAPHRVT
jgi:PII-like signaling protein